MSMFINALNGLNKDNYDDVIVMDTNESITGSSNSVFTDSNFTYLSSIDAISNLYATYSFDTGFTSNMPIVCLGHGYGGDANTITYSQMHNYAVKGFFVICIGMRGRNSASGSQDSSGREIHDIYDAIAHVRANFARVSQKKVSWSGFSGGGGNGLALRCKFPDLCQLTVSHYGMSDYGENSISGWYYTNPAYSATIVSWVGATPAVNINKYKARNAVMAIGENLKAGKLRTYHNNADDAVSVVHSQKIGESITAANKTDLYAASYSNTIYQHGNYDSVTLPDFENEIKNTASFTLTKGKYYIIGFIKTKNFELWLGDGTSGVAIVYFDTIKKKFKITNELIESQNVTIKYDGVAKSGTLLSVLTFSF